MHTGKVLILTEADRNEQPVKEFINYSNFITSKSLWENNDMVIYVNNKGNSKILLNRFGNVGHDYKKEAAELAKEDVKKYYKEINGKRGILQSYIPIHTFNGFTRKYTKDAQIKYDEFYIKHLEELCL